MIGKIKKGSGFKGCVNYVLGKEQAALLHAEGVLAESNRDIIRSFILQAGMNPDLKKPVGHIALSYSPVDAPKLTDGKMVQLAQEYMRALGAPSSEQFSSPPSHFVTRRQPNRFLAQFGAGILFGINRKSSSTSDKQGVFPKWKSSSCRTSAEQPCSPPV